MTSLRVDSILAGLYTTWLFPAYATLHYVVYAQLQYFSAVRAVCAMLAVRVS